MKGEVEMKALSKIMYFIIGLLVLICVIIVLCGKNPELKNGLKTVSEEIAANMASSEEAIVATAAATEEATVEEVQTTSPEPAVPQQVAEVPAPVAAEETQPAAATETSQAPTEEYAAATASETVENSQETYLSQEPRGDSPH